MSTKDHFAFLNNLADTERAILEDHSEIQHYAIFNDRIDHNLLALIHDGNKLLTDDLFFELLAVAPAYLATVLFQNQINRWRELCLWPEGHTKKAVAAARSNLFKIGRVLARSGPGPGAPERWSHEEVRIEYTNTVKFLEKFFAGDGKNTSSRLLTKKYPQLSKAFQDEAGRHEHRSVSEIALRLTKFRLASQKTPWKITLKSLRKITK